MRDCVVSIAKTVKIDYRVYQVAVLKAKLVCRLVVRPFLSKKISSKEKRKHKNVEKTRCSSRMD